MDSQRASIVPLKFNTSEISTKSDLMSASSPMGTDLMMGDYDRTNRAASVLSGMSFEDMEAAETLNSLYNSTFSVAMNMMSPG